MFAGAEDDALAEVIGQMHGLASASMRQLLAALVELDQRETWRIDGVTSAAMWLQMRLGVAEHTARDWVRVARALVYCPAVADVFEAGHLSWDQLVAAVDLVAYSGAGDAEVAVDAVGRTAAELARLAREARRVSRDETLARQQQRHVTVRWDRDRGGARISGWLPDAEAKACELALERGAEGQPLNPDVVPVYRPVGERRADALMDLVSATLGADRDPDRATIVVHTQASALASGNDDLDLAAIELGPVISTSTLHRLACDGRCQVVVDDLLGRVVGVAKTIHAVPRWLRRRVLARDGGCRWPGCGRQALLHAHHILWWTRDGGPTEEANLCALCPFHHRMVHEGGWEIIGDPFGRLTFTSPTGRTITTGPPGLRDDVRAATGLDRWSTDPPGQAA